MKKAILFILAIICFGCTNQTTEKKVDILIVKSKHFKKSENKYEYHYGYSFMSGKYCWHWGMNHHPAEYRIVFSNDSIKKEFNDKSIFERYNEGDEVRFNLDLHFNDGEYRGKTVSLR